MRPIANWTPTAVDDLEQIVYWIAVQDGRPSVAYRIAEELHDKAIDFARLPTKGQRHPDISDDWLYFRHKRWLVFYRITEGGIDVLRVIDSARDFQNLFGQSQTRSLISAGNPGLSGFH